MRVSVETTGGLGRKATVRVPSDTFEAQVAAELNTAATGLRVPGFRPGKVPMKEVRRRLDAKVRGKVARELSNSSFSNAMREQPFTLATPANIEIVNLAAGSDLEFTATFEVLPEFTVAPLDSLGVRLPEVDIEETDVDYTIEQLRLQKRDWIAVQEPAASGHRVVLDYRVKRGDEVLSEREGLTFVLGEGPPLGILQDVLVGLSANETRRLPNMLPAAQGTANEPDQAVAATLPGNDPAQPPMVDAPASDGNGPPDEPATADSEAFAEITLRKVEEGVTPAVDEAFFDWFGVATDGDRQAAFRVDVRERMDLEVQAALRRTARDEVLASLARAHDFDLPPSALAAEIESMGNTQGLREEAVAARVHVAQTRLRARLVMREIVLRESLRPDDERVRERIEQIASGYEESKEVRRALLADAAQMRQLEASVLEEQVVEHVLGRANVSPVRMSYQDLIAGQPLPEAPVVGADAAAEIHPATTDAATPPTMPKTEEPAGWADKVKRLFTR